MELVLVFVVYTSNMGSFVSAMATHVKSIFGENWLSLPLKKYFFVTPINRSALNKLNAKYMLTCAFKQLLKLLMSSLIKFKCFGSKDPRWNHVIKWAASSEKVPSSMRKRCWFTLSCTCAKLIRDLKHSIVSKDSIRGQWRPWLNCADAQADLGFLSPHMPKVTFSHGEPISY